MGIDARMVLSTSYPFKEEEISKLSEMLKEAFHDFYGDEKYFGAYEVNEDVREELRIPADKTVICIGLGLDRYYGTGYERGPILRHILIAAWLEVIIPDCKIWYGGDDFFGPFNKTDRDEIFNHYALFCERPYRRYDRHVEIIPNTVFKVNLEKP